MNYGLGFLAGSIGGAAMAPALMIAEQSSGTTNDLRRGIGSMVTHDLTSSAGMIGLAIPLLVSGVIGLIYAAGFEFITRRATWLIGVGFGVIHVLIGGLLLSAMHQANP